ncbi:proteolipid membrane potential modulator [mine drainage metagenome]|uniref:Proteolipid membrane potential modulator n=1 Tax=mine drainage metagenome TaxID=410659 RepID=A0A1J5SCR7_9ZZZZ
MKKFFYTYLIASAATLFFVPTAFGSISFPKHQKLGPVYNPDTSGNNATVDAITLRNAMNEFNSLSRQERKSRLKEVKSLLKEYKAQKAQGGEASTNTILLVILAVLLPPLAVYLHENELNTKFWISLILTLLLWLPGLIYALIVILG